MIQSKVGCVAQNAEYMFNYTNFVSCVHCSASFITFVNIHEHNCTQDEVSAAGSNTLEFSAIRR